MTWSIEPKTSLTPDEVLRVAYGNLICGVHQHHLAAILGVDSGRIAEAVVVMREAAEDHMRLYRQRDRANG